jgi:hypothetical protein
MRSFLNVNWEAVICEINSALSPAYEIKRKKNLAYLKFTRVTLM